MPNRFEARGVEPTAHRGRLDRPRALRLERQVDEPEAQPRDPLQLPLERLRRVVHQAEEHAAASHTLGPVRFPVVLLDLDGTVVDSGAIILASMRHATRTVLGREIPDEVLMARSAARARAQMRDVRRPTTSRSSSASTASTTSRCTRSSRCCAGMVDVLVAAQGRGRRLGIVSAKRHATVELAFARVAARPPLRRDRRRRRDRAPEAGPRPLLLALERLGARPGDAAYVGDSPFDMQAGAGRGHARGRRHVGRHPRARCARRRRRRRRHAGGAACRPLSRGARRRAARAAHRWSHAYHVLDEPAVDDATYDRHYDELVALEASTPSSSRPTRPTQRVGAPPSERFRKVQHLSRWARSRR